jgi:hypothetical protein
MRFPTAVAKFYLSKKGYTFKHEDVFRFKQAKTDPPFWFLWVTRKKDEKVVACTLASTTGKFTFQIHNSMKPFTVKGLVQDKTQKELPDGVPSTKTNVRRSPRRRTPRIQDSAAGRQDNASSPQPGSEAGGRSVSGVLNESLPDSKDPSTNNPA